MAHNLFYEDLNTGLESFTPVIRKVDLPLFENVGAVDIEIPIEIKIMIDGFYTLNIALQDLIGQPQFEMVISFRVSEA